MQNILFIISALALFYVGVSIRIGLLRDKGNVEVTLGPLKYVLVNFLRKDDWHWSLNLAFSGLVAIPVMIILRRYTGLSIEVFLLLLLCCSLSGLLLWKYLKKFLDFRLFLVFCGLGSGVWGVIIIFSLNFLIPITNNTTKQYTIIERESFGATRRSPPFSYELKLSEDELNDYSSFLTFNTSSLPPDFYEYDHITITYRIGLFGMPVMRDHLFSH